MRRKIYVVLASLFAIAALSPASPVSAESTALAGKALRAALVGKTVYISTPVGALPIRYRANGTMSGRSPALAKFTNVTKDRGRWWVSNGQLCQRWKNWLDGKQFCFKLRRKGAKMHWVSSDGRTGTARISK